MDDNTCAMCYMKIGTKEEKNAHIWDVMISCDEIADLIREDKKDEAIGHLYALRECLHQIKGMD